MTKTEIKEQNIEKALKTAFKLFLKHGIQNTTKLMIAKESGLSRPSIDRYFASNTDCVMQVAGYVGRKVRAINTFPDALFTDGEYTGVQLLQMYMEKALALYKREYRLYALLVEYKLFIYNNYDNLEKGYDQLLQPLGIEPLIQKIYLLGIRDGSFSPDMNATAEAMYFCEGILGFLANMALTSQAKSPATIRQIERYMGNIMAHYTHAK